MPELPSNTPPRREDRSSDRSGLLSMLAFAGAALGAYKGGGYVMRNMPKQLRQKFIQRISKTAHKAIDEIEKHPAYRHVDRTLFSSPAQNQSVLSRILSEVDQRSFGLIQELETVLKVQGGTNTADFLDATKKNILVNHDLNIPQLAEGSWRRMTLGDLIRTANAPTSQIRGNPVLADSGRRIPQIARSLGMKQEDLLGLRLSPFAWINKRNDIRDLRNLNVWEKLAKRVGNIRPLGLPLFKLRPDQRGKKMGSAIFDNRFDEADDASHPIIKMLTGKDRGQLVVSGEKAWFREDTSQKLEMLENVSGLKLTSDFSMGEMFLRRNLTTEQYDRALYGYRGPQGAANIEEGQGFWGSIKGIGRAFGIGKDFMPKNVHGPMGTLADLENQKGVPGFAKKFLAAVDPTGIVNSKTASLAGRRVGIGSTPTTFNQAGETGPLFVTQGGLKGFGDWLNVQASRPTWLLNRMGIGMRPGKNFLATTAKMSAFATAGYMATQGVHYADWMLGNVPSDIIREGVGGYIQARQQVLETTGLRDEFQDLEKEYPGLVDSPLSKLLRLGTLTLGGAALGKRLGAPAAIGKFLGDKLPRSMSVGIRGVLRNLKNQGFEDSRTAFSGMVAGLGVGFGAGLLAAGDLTKSPEEIKQEREGVRQTPYRASAGWMLGRDPFAGGRIRYHKPSLLRSFGVDYMGVGVYGSEANKWKYGSWLPTPTNWFGARRLLNPYFAEERNANTRPYPVTSGHFGDVPLFGPALQSTIGSILKPTRTVEGVGTSGGGVGALRDMNTAEHRAAAAAIGTHFSGNPSGHYVGSPEAQMAMGYGPGGGIPGIQDPQGLAQVTGHSIRGFEEFIGLRGFQTQFLRNMFLGSEHPTLRGAVTAQSGAMTSANRAYYGAEPGGLYGASELLRRFLIRPYNQPTVNTIPNSLPRWLPGSMSMFEQDRSHHRDFSLGDPYTEIPLGEARLPGPGRDALYEKHGGAAYSIVDAFLVTADVAPFTQSYRVLKQEVDRLIRQDKLSPEWVMKYRVAIEQAEQRSNFRVFHSDRYKEHKNFTIDKVLGPTKFTVKELPGHEIKLGGTQLDYAEPAGLLADRVAQGMTYDQAKVSIAQNKDTLRNALEERRGRSISMQITGSKGGKITARIEDVNRMAEDMGVAEEDDLYEQGITGKAYTKAGKLVGEGGALAGLILGAMGHGFKSKSAFAPKGSAASALFTMGATAAVGGLLGGWAENKFTGDFTAVEHYERFQKYGSTFADWMTPYKSFVRPWINTAASAVGDFTPPHRQRQYEMEAYFDKLKRYKYTMLEKQASEAGQGQAAYKFSQMSKATMVGLDYANLTANSPGLAQAIPNNERHYFKQFAAEQDPEERAKILRTVPDYMKSIYLAIWNNELPEDTMLPDELREQYAEHVQPKIDYSPEQRTEAFFDDNYLPPPSWGGWHPSASIQDIKYKTVQMSGGSPHDHGLFRSQESRIEAYQPWITDAAEELADNMGNVDQVIAANRMMREKDDGANLFQAPVYSMMGPSHDIRMSQDDTERYYEYINKYARGDVGIY